MASVSADVIAPLEAAFQLDDADEATWLRRVTDAMVPWFDQGLGTHAWLIRPEPLGGATLDSIISFDAPTHTVEGLQSMHAEAGPEDQAVAYPSSPGLHSLGTLFGPDRYFSSPVLRRWIHARKVVDAGAVHIALGDRRLIVGATLREIATFPRVVARFAARLGRRITNAYAFRKALEAKELPAAILTRDGKVVHASAGGTPKSARERLRGAVIAREKARGPLRRRDPTLAFDLFEGITAGRFTIADRFESDGRRYMVAYENSPELAALRALTGREAEILRRAVEGEPVKRIASDLDMSPSTAASYLAAIRKKTGFRSREEMVRWLHRRMSGAVS
jgi:DNA-binding CsgD family transcriptional regulator